MASITALPLLVSFPSKAGTPMSEWLALVAALADRTRRSEAAHALANQLGADDLLIFSPDPEIGPLLPALGFPQTLPEGLSWRAFLKKCAAEGQAIGSLCCPYSHETKGALGIRGNCGSALVLLGGKPRHEDLKEIQALLPLLAAAFQGERAALTAEAHAAVAQQAAAQAEDLAKSLDQSRKQLGVALDKAKASAAENAQLYQKMRAADRHKNEFLAMLAHELRNPLAPIQNAVQIIDAKAPPVPELQWAKDVVNRQVQQLCRLVDDLLDLSRISRGKIALCKERIELAAVVNNAVESSRPLIDQRGHSLIITLPPEPVLLEADPARLAQVLLNLLNNAAKYTDRGGLINLLAEQGEDKITIRVKDTGIGIPPEKLPQVFDMFTQVERPGSSTQDGLGIGLTLVQRLLELHGGTVEAYSAGIGKGSEFVIRLPKAAPANDDQQGQQDRTEKDNKLFAVPKKRILVVDDNRDAADSLAMLLNMAGYETHIAYDGFKALAAAAVLRADVVLLDIDLSKLNGYEVARRIRHEQGDKVKLIALTGLGQEADHRRSKEAGFDHHLTKPIEFDALQQLLA